MHEVKFVSFSPVRWFCVSIIISPTTGTQRGRGGNVPLPNRPFPLSTREETPAQETHRTECSGLNGGP